MVTVVYLDLHLEKGLLKFYNSTVFLDKSLQIQPVFSSPHFPTLSAVICVLRIRVKNMPFHIHIQVYLVVFSLDVLNFEYNFVPENEKFKELRSITVHNNNPFTL